MFRHVIGLLATFWTAEGVACKVLLSRVTVCFLFGVCYQLGQPGQGACGGPAAV